MNIDRNWTVLFIGGSSGTGKSSIAYEIARFYGVNVLEVDDVLLSVETVTTDDEGRPIAGHRGHLRSRAFATGPMPDLDESAWNADARPSGRELSDQIVDISAMDRYDTTVVALRVFFSGSHHRKERYPGCHGQRLKHRGLVSAGSR